MGRYFGAQPQVSSQLNPAVIAVALLLFVCSSLSVSLLLLYEPAPADAAFEVPPPPAAPALRTVLVPLREIPARMQLTPALFKQADIPDAAYMPGMIDSFEQVSGSYTKALLVAERPFYVSHLTPNRPTSEVSAVIAPGYRGVAIHVNEETSVEGWVRPGSHVDVALITAIQGRRMLRIIVSNALVLSAARDTSQEVKPGAPVPSTVTLMVTPREGAAIRLGAEVGKLSLLLRGDDGRDYKVGDTLWLDELTLLGQDNRPRVMPQYEGYVVVDGHKYFVKGGTLERQS